jgi:hypothetical protein
MAGLLRGIELGYISGSECQEANRYRKHPTGNGAQ